MVVSRLRHTDCYISFGHISLFRADNVFGTRVVHGHLSGGSLVRGCITVTVRLLGLNPTHPTNPTDPTDPNPNPIEKNSRTSEPRTNERIPLGLHPTKLAYHSQVGFNSTSSASSVHSDYSTLYLYIMHNSAAEIIQVVIARPG